MGIVLILLINVKKYAWFFCYNSDDSSWFFALRKHKYCDSIHFPLCGLFFAIMYPSILSLGMNSILEHHGALSGILCTGICGAAVISLFIGFLGDLIGLKLAMCIIFIPLFYVLFISIWAKPIIKNKSLF